MLKYLQTHKSDTNVKSWLLKDHVPLHPCALSPCSCIRSFIASISHFVWVNKTSQITTQNAQHAYCCFQSRITVLFTTLFTESLMQSLWGVSLIKAKAYALNAECQSVAKDRNHVFFVGFFFPHVAPLCTHINRPFSQTSFRKEKCNLSNMFLSTK